MKVEENLTRYHCDFCSKKLFVKGAMVRHEKMCGNNPENAKACNGCKFIEEVEVPYEVDHDDYGSVTRNAKGFRCTKLNKLLYPLIVEKKKLPERYPHTFENQEPMPKECEYREVENFDWF